MKKILAVFLSLLMIASFLPTGASAASATPVMTAEDFVSKAVDIAQNYKTLYVMGCFGSPLNSTNKARYTSNHSYNKQEERKAMINNASSDTFGFDCVCLIKGILWGWNGDLSKTYGGAKYTSNGVPDIGADSMIKVCSDISTDFSNISVGEAVWMSGHIGIYIGNGLAVECTPKWGNCVQITACNQSISDYNRRDWTKHGKLPYIAYGSSDDHEFVERVSDNCLKTVASCNSKAVYYKSCRVCGERSSETFETGEYDYSNHIGETYLNGQKEASCCENGYTGDIYCVGCNQKIKSGSEISATGKHIDADGEWESDETSHWHTCYLGTKFDVEQHIGGEATFTSKAVCSVCKTAYGEIKSPSITFSFSHIVMAIDEIIVLDVKTEPGNQDVIWESSDESIATVSDGVVTAKSSGKAIITAKFVYDGKEYSKSCEVTVKGDKQLLADVNYDGVVDLNDAVLAAKAAVGSVQVTDSFIKKADVNDDGKVTIHDALLIARFASGVIAELPVSKMR